jgi:hypothetical protein
MLDLGQSRHVVAFLLRPVSNATIKVWNRDALIAVVQLSDDFTERLQRIVNRAAEIARVQIAFHSALF